MEWNNVFESNYRVEICSKCETQTYIFNRTHMLCENCNCWRLKGKSLIEVRKEKQAAYKQRQLKKSLLKKQNAPQGIKTHVPKVRIKHVSEKQKEINEKLKRVKDKITEDAINQNQYFCRGCGIVSLHLDRSHILSIAQRKDLALDADNICLYCRSCHTKWESFNPEKLLELNNFVESMEYIHKKDTETFNKIFFKLLDYYEKVKYPSVLKLLKKIEAFEQTNYA